VFQQRIHSYSGKLSALHRLLRLVYHKCVSELFCMSANVAAVTQLREGHPLHSGGESTVGCTIHWVCFHIWMEAMC
jgi:hypothetical protein